MPWNKIDNLLKKTETFYKKALWNNFATKIQNKTAETHDEKIKRLEKEKAAKQKLLKEQADAFLRANKPKKEEAPESEIPPESITEDGLEQEIDEESPQSGTPGEDLALYPELINLSDHTSNLDVADEIRLLAELYKNTIRTNSGYAYMANAINNFINNTLTENYAEYEDEEDKDYDDEATVRQDQKRQGEAVENLFNNVYTDIKRRAAANGKDIKTKDSPAVIQQLNALKNNIFQEQEKKRRSDEGLTPEQIAKLEQGGGEDEEGDDYKGTLDKSELAGKRAPEGGATPGMGVWEPYKPKEWANSYKGDMERYKDQLTSITDPNDKKNTLELINVLDQLHKVTMDKEAMLNDSTVSWTVKPRILSPDKKTVIAPRTKTIDDPQQKAAYDALVDAQQKLKQKKTLITSRLRAHKANEDNNVFATKMSSAGPKEKRLLEQKIALNNLIKSSDKRKSRELQLRKQLVSSLGGNIDPSDPMYVNRQNPEEYLPDVSQEHINHMMEKISEAAGLKITSYQANVEQAENIKKEFHYDRNRRGPPLSVEGIFIQFKQSIPSIKMGIKKKITAEFRESKNTVYLPHREAISLALQSGDDNAVKFAEKAFQKQLNDDAEKHPAIQSFVTYSESFIKYLVELKALHKKEAATEENGMVLLSATSPDIIQNFITEGKRLFALEMVRNPGDTRKGISNVAKAIAIIIKQLETRVQDQKQSEGFNQMNIKQKLAVLQAHLEKEEALKKLAEESGDTNFYVGTTEQLTEQQLAPHLPQQLNNMTMSKAEADAKADKIMDNIIDNLKIKGLDY